MNPLKGNSSNVKHKYDEGKLNYLLNLISIKCEENNIYINNDGLFNGKSGVSLFYFYYYSHTKSEKYFNLGSKLILEILEDLNRGKLVTPYLSNGLCGIVWCIDHLFEKGYLSDPAENIFGVKLYDSLTNIAIESLSLNNYDYSHGALGIMAYLNARGKDVSPILRKIIDNSNSIGNEVFWNPIIFSPALPHKKDLTLAHGNAGVLAVLLQLLEKTKEKKMLREIIKASSNYLLRGINRNSNVDLIFPDYVTNEYRNEHGINMQLSWCTGDLGILYTLHKALNILNEDKENEKIMALLEKCAFKRHEIGSGSPDLFFCHGCIGHAHIFNRLYRETRHSLFFTASEYWLNHISESKLNSSIYKNQINSDLPNSMKLGLINGISGIGLSLILLMSPESAIRHFGEMFLL
ncbi:lanthionine synthetase LanC family protein [Compostibacter hankyongensis]|uniref:Lanthionine synthetase C-like protein n=1 Tax=Compostibacter hankyongensis TaxID=1007089 RepID=A0ABP8FSR7_9BACT